MRWTRKTRLGQVMTGLSLLAAAYVVAVILNTPMTSSPVASERVHQPAAFMEVELPRLAAPAPVGEGMSATWGGMTRAGTGFQR